MCWIITTPTCTCSTRGTWVPSCSIITGEYRWPDKWGKWTHVSRVLMFLLQKSDFSHKYKWSHAARDWMWIFSYMYVFITLIKGSSHYQLFYIVIANISLSIKDDHFSLCDWCYFFISHLISIFRHFLLKFWRFRSLIPKVNDLEVSVCSPKSRSQLSTRAQSSFGIKLNLNLRAGIMFFFRWQVTNTRPALQKWTGTGGK